VRVVDCVSCSSVSFIAFANSLVNVVAAVMERVLYHVVGGVASRPREPKTSSFFRVMRPTWMRLVRFSGTSAPITPMQFAALYTGRRLRLYTQAAVQYLASGIIRAMSFCSSFLKWEKIQQKMKRQIPRVISPRSPVFNVGIGRYIKPLEEATYHALSCLFSFDHYSYPVVMKGLNCFQQGAAFAKEWHSLRRPVAVGLDMNRFDQHVSVAALKWEHRWWLSWFRGDDRRELANLLRMQLKNRLYFHVDGWSVRVEREGGRCSGDMNTGSGNTLLMCAMMHAYLAARGIPLRDVRVFDNGDDVIIMMERKWLSAFQHQLPEWFDSLGFVPEVEKPVYELESIEFCQTHPVFDGTKWRMVRNVPSCMTKDATVIHPILTETDWRDYLASIGACGLSLTAGMPVMQEFYEFFTRADGKVRAEYYEETGMGWLARGLHPRHAPVTEQARVSFALAFGIQPWEQRQLEKELATLSPPAYHWGRERTLF